MSGAAGQATSAQPPPEARPPQSRGRQGQGWRGRWLRRFFGAVFTLALLLGAGVAALAWRLAEGPLELPMLASRIEESLNRPDAPQRFDVGHATIAWAGWRHGHASPFQIVLRNIRARSPDGTTWVELPETAVTFSLSTLFRGQFAPRTIELRGPQLVVSRTADGTWALDLGEAEAAIPNGAAAPAPGASTAAQVFAELMLPVSEATTASALRSVTLTGGRVQVVDRQLRRAWSLDRLEVRLDRGIGGGVTGRGRAMLRLEDQDVPLTVQLAIEGAPVRIGIGIALPQVQPAALGRAVPLLAPLTLLDASVAVEVEAVFDTDGRALLAEAGLHAGPGSLNIGQGRVAIAGIEAEARITGDTATLGPMRIALAPAPVAPAPVTPGASAPSVPSASAPTRDAVPRDPRGSPGTRSEAAPGSRAPATAVRSVPNTPGPVIGIAGEALRADGTWRGALDVTLDRVAFADLARHWPDGIAPGARQWMSENVTAGQARDGRWRLAAEIAEDFSTARVTGLTGTLNADAATVHWLRPVPPAEGAMGVANFTLDAIDLRIASAQQSGTAVQVREGTVRFTGLGLGTEEVAMELRLAGPVADVMGVLKHPRLRLFDRQVVPLPDLFGQVTDSRLSIALPLINALPIEELRIGVQARIEQARIPTALLGRDIERGTFDVTANTEGLRVAGTATVAEVPARLVVEMDFRRGNAQQVVTRETLTARVEASRFAAFGLDVSGILNGAVALEARQETRRGGAGRLTLRADLREAGVQADALGWTKARGTPGSLDAVLRFQAGRLAAVESLRAEAPGALLRARAAAFRDNIPERVEIQEARLGQSRFTGEVRGPTAPGGAWGVTLAGPMLDVAGALSRATPAAPPEASPAPDAPGPAFDADLRFDRVILGPGRDINGLVARARVDALGVVREARASGGTGSGAFEITITPEGQQRALSITAVDAGALLRNFDVLRTLNGGRMSVTGRYESNRPGATLAGTAEITDFSVRDPTALGKLLQAMTLYGLFEAASGPGLGFTRLTAPFRFSPGLLELEDARAFSASLGFTARGRIDRRAETVDMQGTIVPAYFFNSLLGNIPLVGRIFSPEAGGGLFAASYRIRGPIADPSVGVNPLAALTPGFLRGIFGLAEQGGGAAPPGAPP